MTRHLTLGQTQPWQTGPIPSEDPGSNDRMQRTEQSAKTSCHHANSIPPKMKEGQAIHLPAPSLSISIHSSPCPFRSPSTLPCARLQIARLNPSFGSPLLECSFL